MLDKSHSAADHKIISNRVAEFISHREIRLKKQTHPFQNLTLLQLTQKASFISSNQIKPFLQAQIPTAEKTVLELVQKALNEIRITLNQFPHKKRFFISETINFFENRNQIEKVISALLFTREQAKQQDMLEFIYSTFSTLNKNIETIISTPQLFSSASLHIERGGLYSLASDIARLMSQFFKKEFLAKQEDSASDVVKIKTIFANFRFTNSPRQTTLSLFHIEGLIADTTQLRETLLAFISAIQTHDLLLLYAQKRHQYYAYFLKTIVQRTTVKRLESQHLCGILAGCLLQNTQLDPGKQLIRELISKPGLDSTATRQLYETFVDQLAPSGIYNLIQDYKQSLQQILHPPKREPSPLKTKPFLKSVLNSVRHRRATTKRPPAKKE